MLTAIAKLTTALVFLFESAGPPATPKIELASVEQHILDGTNAQRVRNGLPPLEVDPDLEKTAREHAAWMAKNNSLQHTSQAVGENIAWGQSSPEEAVTDWMNSSGHRANILGTGYHKIGVAEYTAADGSKYWCQQFLQ